jgi:exodeoxyribonuclease III
VRFVTLNVSGPSAARASRLLEFLPSLEADVLVLTETRQNQGTAELLGSYRDSGYAVVAAQSMDASERGVAVIQRVGRPVPLVRELTAEAQHRLVASEVCADQAITVIGAYVPSRDASPAKIARKQRFLSQMTALAGRWANERLVFLGDLNIVSRQHVPHFTTFRCWEYDALEALEHHGLVDAHALLHPDEQVHSWIGRKGAGYRYDYAFVSAGLVPYLVDCEYVHEPRELGLSDHAAVVLTLDLPVAQVSPPARSQQRTERAVAI